MMALGLVLAISWLLPFTHNLWEFLDVWIFKTTNQFLREHTSFWPVLSFLSQRLFDVPLDITLILFLLYYVVRDKKKKSFRERLLFCISVFVCAALGVMLFKLGYKFLNTYRSSPTYVYPESFRLSIAMGNPLIRDCSRMSFPSDHALISFLWGMCAWYLLRGKVGILAFLFALVTTLPRIFTGAHWFSDVFVGALCSVCFIFAFCIATSIKEHIVRFLNKVSTFFYFSQR